MWWLAESRIESDTQQRKLAMKFKAEIEQWERDSKLLATLNGKRQDDDQVLSMEWLEGAIEWERNSKLADKYKFCATGVLRVDEYEEKVMVELSGNLVPQIKTRGQFRALCKALGIEIKEGV